jgi:DNA recombination protein RmuC
MLVALLVLAAISVVLQFVLFFKAQANDLSGVTLRFEDLEKDLERWERGLRDELGKNREEGAGQARQDREELSGALARSNDLIVKNVQFLSTSQKEQLEKLTETNERKLEHLRAIIDERLRSIQEDNGKRLEQMRATVDEKLQGTLEKRLGESFKLVSERLEEVHKGLGEMQGLAVGVGDLKRVLTNVKTRGSWGEVQLEALLSELLIPSQYAKNVKTNQQSEDLVEFVIKLPGRGTGDQEVLLPVDSKFPSEDYQRLLEAFENGDAKGIEDARVKLEQRIKVFAKDISQKYIHPPATTDFGIMFLPTEGLYAEVVRRSGLMECLQRDYRIVLSGPATFGAFLNSLQMGFRTLTIEKRSSEVWQLLGAVKAEFGKFSEVLAGVKKKLEQASTSMDAAATRSRAIERRLRDVEALPTPEGVQLLSNIEPDDEAANS